MADIIQLLPDNIANQIAAGEVIQRPASAVKELLENAVDAGSSEIRLYVNDAGKQLVQVIDNGSGMSETDARMAFERHATSKIRQIDDLFQIRTMGFRGEALASIAAVAQVEVKTRQQDQELGVLLEIENSVVRRQEPVQAPMGTSISMKNLFFNVPARRNFLKSNAAEMRHIVDEFTRVALAFPHIFFSLHSNGQEIFHLGKGSRKQRIVQLLGSQYNARLVPVQEQTDYMNISGYVGKPDTARKTRGDQYFFVNNRFIRSAYLHHAVMTAYQDLIPSDSHPLYMLYIDLDPSQVDINVHPTKQEIKFEDEKIIYAFVQAAVKHALAQFSITPTLDFDLDPGIQQLDAVSKPFTGEQQQQARASALFNTFTKGNQAHLVQGTRSDLKGWREFYQPSQPDSSGNNNDFSQSPINEQKPFVPLTQRELIPDHSGISLPDEKDLHQLHQSFIMAPTPDGHILVHQQNAHERVLYERYLNASDSAPLSAQRSLFPITIQLPPADSVLLDTLLPELAQLGYLVEPFGKDTFVIQGTPADIPGGEESGALEGLLEQFKHFNPDLKLSQREKLIRTLAARHATKAGQTLSRREMHHLLEQLFHCQHPAHTPDGKPTFLSFPNEQLQRMFGRNR